MSAFDPERTLAFLTLLTFQNGGAVGTISRVEPGATNEAARLHYPCQLSGHVAAYGARAAADDACDRVY
jgi:hypothetical protein